tara:strand:+ start:478 stop:1923 length:1446 start_codon:yes stop_codon:yes gene_type:complete
MIAKQLETVLSAEAAKTDFSQRAHADMVQRFQSVRDYGLLPRGRGKNAQHLTHKNAVAGILSLVADKPGWGGHAAKILLGLKPVGGVDASFGGAATFGAALVEILNDPDALDTVLEVRATGSEVYINSNGRGTIVYIQDGEIRTAYYVGATAVSMTRRGAERGFDPRSLISTAIKETVFFPRLFERVAREMRIQYPDHAFDHLIDPDEDELERQKEERIRKLGITADSNFLNLSVDTQVTWPKEETVVEFGDRRLVLMPTTKESDTSIHIDLRGARLSSGEAHTLINRFLSLLTWCDDQFCTLQDGSSGSRFPTAMGKRDLAFATAYQWPFGRQMPESKDAQIALALYRQGRNAEQNYLVAYAVLSYVKVIEIRHGKSGRRGEKGEAEKWFEANYGPFKDSNNLTPEIKRFEEACGEEEPPRYIWKMCRVAVAHVSKGHRSDPDDFDELRRLHVAADVIRGLARYFIKEELGVSTSSYDGT